MVVTFLLHTQSRHKDRYVVELYSYPPDQFELTQVIHVRMHWTVETKGPEGALIRVVLVIMLAFLLILSLKKRPLNSLFKKEATIILISLHFFSDRINVHNLFKL